MYDLAKEMKAVARGEKPAPADAATVSFESAEALLRLLTPENRELLRIIRDEKPQSVAELSRRTKRAGPILRARSISLPPWGLWRCAASSAAACRWPSTEGFGSKLILTARMTNWSRPEAALPRN